jgi:hypothetical protein
MLLFRGSLARIRAQQLCSVVPHCVEYVKSALLPAAHCCRLRRLLSNTNCSLLATTMQRPA